MLTILCGKQAESDVSSDESEFKGEGEEFSESSSSESGSYSDGSNASEDSGSDFGDGSESEGLSWDEQEKRAAKGTAVLLTSCLRILIANTILRRQNQNRNDPGKARRLRL